MRRNDCPPYHSARIDLRTAPGPDSPGWEPVHCLPNAPGFEDLPRLRKTGKTGLWIRVIRQLIASAGTGPPSRQEPLG